MRKRAPNADDIFDINGKLTAQLAIVSMMSITLTDAQRKAIVDQLESLAGRHFPLRARVLQDSYRRELKAFVGMLKAQMEGQSSDAQGT